VTRVTSPVGNRPTTALLVIEVAETSLARDCKKVAMYAAAGVAEYWTIDLTARQIEQYFGPSVEGRYGGSKVLRIGESIECRVLPVPARLIADLLPPA
jgi:Uma2 family endonuclease